MNELEEIWQFLPQEDDIEQVPSCAEEAALHVVVPAEWERAFDDTARRDVATADEDWTGVIVADDEDDGAVHRDAEYEFDVEELLERQHYSFAPSAE